MGTAGSIGRPPASATLVTVAGLTAITCVVAGLAWAITNTSYDVWGALVVAVVLLGFTIPIARHVAKVEEDPRLVKIIMFALLLKMLASLARYFVAFDVYDGSADAAIYIRRGYEYGAQIRLGDFTYERGYGGGDGTHFIMQLSGWVFALIGPTAIGGFIVFSWLGFWGLYFSYRAFSIGVPDGDRRRYALLVFFLPSLLFWPSSVGKEAWMLLMLGLAAYGTARLLTFRRGGYVLAAVGLLGTAAVRPHMTALVAAALAASYLVRRSAGRSTFSGVGKVLGAGVVLAALLFAVQAAEEKFGVDGQGLAGAATAIDETAEQTSKGGSEYEAQRPDSITDVPAAAFTVLFRPLPHEAHNAQALMTSLEGVFLLGLVVVSRRRLMRAVPVAWRTPFVAFAAVYSMLFMIAFSSFGNFGILARQRSQLFPLFLVLLAVPAAKQAVTARRPAHRVAPSVGQEAL